MAIRKVRRLLEIYQSTSTKNESFHFSLMGHIQDEPLVFQEAVNQPKWINAMNEEITSIEKNNTWKLLDVLMHKKAIGVKWIYKLKHNADGLVQRYKKRLVVKGFAQTHGVDYYETFAPIARLEIIRMVITLAAQHK